MGYMMCVYLYIHIYYHQQFDHMFKTSFLYRIPPNKKKTHLWNLLKRWKLSPSLPRLRASARSAASNFLAAAALLGAATPPWSRVDQLLDPPSPPKV